MSADVWSFVCSVRLQRFNCYSEHEGVARGGVSCHRETLRWPWIKAGDGSRSAHHAGAAPKPAGPDILSKLTRWHPRESWVSSAPNTFCWVCVSEAAAG